MNKKLLTIVIPVYKVEKYIRQCLDSVIVPQDQMEQLEVIVVNDGTPDKSALIAKEYAMRYPETIRVIDKENGGHGSAWNVGLKMATGKFIRFLDSDDWLTNLSEFICHLESMDVDLVFTHLRKYYDDTGIETVDYLCGVEFCRILSTDDIPPLLIQTTSDLFNFHRCTYRTSLLQREQPLFCERVYYDDSILFIAPLLLGNSLCFMDSVLYNHRLSREGQTIDAAVMKKHADDYVIVCKKMTDFVNGHAEISKSKKEQRDIIMYVYMRILFRLFTSLPYDDYKRLMKEWFPVIKKLPEFRLTPKMLVYKYTPVFVSWYSIKLVDKYVFKSRG